MLNFLTYIIRLCHWVKITYRLSHLLQAPSVWSRVLFFTWDPEDTYGVIVFLFLTYKDLIRYLMRITPKLWRRGLVSKILLVRVLNFLTYIIRLCHFIALLPKTFIPWTKTVIIQIKTMIVYFDSSYHRFMVYFYKKCRFFFTPLLSYFKKSFNYLGYQLKNLFYSPVLKTF